MQHLDGLSTLPIGVEDGKGNSHLSSLGRRDNDIIWLQPKALEEGQELWLVDVRVEGANKNLVLINLPGHCATQSSGNPTGIQEQCSGNPVAMQQQLKNNPLSLELHTHNHDVKALQALKTLRYRGIYRDI